jgi:hypothetical protein
MFTIPAILIISKLLLCERCSCTITVDHPKINYAIIYCCTIRLLDTLPFLTYFMLRMSYIVDFKTYIMMTFTAQLVMNHCTAIRI